jgi:tetraacyldisaccharide 4'-kinase
MRRPAFWSRSSWVTEALSPLSYPYAAITARRMARTGWRAPVPVLCVGNATVGGAGKTTLVLDLARRLTARGIAAHVLTRGYGGSARGPHRVAAGDTVATVGDEALLLAEVAPTWTGADRAASARAAVAARAEALLMDDGLQNPSLEKTMSLLAIDGATGFGNGKVVPVGPLREPVAAAAARCRAAVLIGEDESGALAMLPRGMQVIRTRLKQDPEDIASLGGRPVIAFAGLARPEKFFEGLERAGINLVGRRSFADHHTFSAAEIAALRRVAASENAVLVTTPKDAVRLSDAICARIVHVRIRFDTETIFESLLNELVSRDVNVRYTAPSLVHGDPM